MHSFSTKFSSAECKYCGCTEGKTWCCSKRVGWSGEEDTLTTISKSASHTAKSCFMKPGKTMAPIPAQGSAKPLWNVLFKIHWSLDKCLLPTCLDKCWLWIHPKALNLSHFPWSTSGKSEQAFSNKILCKCNSVWLRRSMSKLPHPPKEFSILLFIYFKIFYLLIFLLLFLRDFFFECLTAPL